ncbi:hypothetical protein SF123566_2065 [Shigella flexneri 1235-66]|nr:hypothetical protein SF123566_2065 [Shigella flexneri 1235-66]
MKGRFFFPDQLPATHYTSFIQSDLFLLFSVRQLCFFLNLDYT